MSSMDGFTAHWLAASSSIFDVIIETSDYGIKNSIMMQKARGPLEPL